jgi:fibronectin-binding autotransporter adhesin
MGGFMAAPLSLRRNARLILALLSNLFAISVLAGVGTTPALAQTTSTWSGGSGNWAPCPGQGGTALWDTCSSNIYPDGNFSAVINGGQVFATGASVVNLTIAPSAILSVTPNYVEITGPSLFNQGTINIGASNGLQFAPSQTTTISGTGTINLTDPNARILGGGNPVVNSTNTIQGQGYIGVLTFTNQSTIDANVSGAQIELAGGVSVSNSGTMQASNGGTLLLQGSSLNVPFNNSGGTIQALTGSTVMVDAYAISGGTLVSTGSGLFSTFGGSGNPTLSNLTNNATYQIVSGGSSTIAGTINNLGTIQVKGGLFVNGSATLKGGSVPIAYPEGSIISLSGATTLVNQSNIAGSGFIGDANLTFTNQGTVNATDSANPLVFNGSASNNTGTMEASGGGTLHIQNTINNNGGTIEALAGSTVLVFSNTGVISGGTLKTTGTGVFDTNSGTLDGTVNPVNNAGMFKVSQGNLVLQGTINNTGTIALDKAGFFAILNQPTTLTGSGRVMMSPNTAFLGGNTLTNQSTIEGAGFIGGSTPMGITNSGTIIANKTTPLVISPDATLGFTNTGKLMVSKGSTLNIAGLCNNFSGTTLIGGTYLVTGTLEFQNSIVTNAGSITLTGPTAQIFNTFTNTSALANLVANSALGSLSLQSGQVLATATNFSNAGKTTVGVGSGFSIGGSYTQTAGTTTVDGALMAPSGLTLQKGSLVGKGTIAAAVTSSASVTAGDSPSKPATLTVTGSYTQNSAGTLNVSIGGTAVGSYSQVAVSNGVSLGGTLVIKRINSFVPAIGNTFKIVTGSAVSGQFVTVKGTSINSSEHFEVSYTPTAVTLTVVSGA